LPSSSLVVAAEQVQHDRGELEIVPKPMHKGKFVKEILEQSEDASDGLPPDFIFIIGDDVSDEKMFSSVLSYVAGTSETVPSGGEPNALSMGAEAMLCMGEEQYMATKSPSRPTRSPRSAFLDSGRVFTCTVGKKPSIAGCYVEKVAEVHSLLTALTKQQSADAAGVSGASATESAPGLDRHG
jgi:trehalose 6-phosphate synthase/phosphatase